MIPAMDYRPPEFPAANPEEADIERLARKRAKAKMGWYSHAAVYVCVNLFLFALSSWRGHGNWHLAPLLGWGLGLALHGVSVFWIGQGSELSERLVQRERERLQRARERR